MLDHGHPPGSGPKGLPLAKDTGSTSSAAAIAFKREVF
jgi:hypothetical protein